MATQAQIALAAGGTASAVAGGYGINYALGSNNELPQDNKQGDRSKVKKPVEDQVETFNEPTLPTDYSDTKYLITLFKQNSLTKLVKPKGNDVWFNWTFKEQYQKDTTSPKHEFFTGLLETGDKTLDKACDQAYKTGLNNYNFNNHLLKNIFDFCTLKTGLEIKSFTEPKVSTGYTEAAEGYTNGVLSVEANKQHLVKTTDNEYWWKWAYEYLVKPVNKTERSSLFNTVEHGYKSEAGNDNTYLNKACDEAYKKNKTELTTGTSSILNDIKRFCTTGLTEKPITEPADPEVIPTTQPSENVTVFDVTDLGSDYPTTTILGILKKENRNQFVKAKGATTENNKTKDWWTWSFNERFEKRDPKDTSKLHTVFHLVKKAYDDEPVKTGSDIKQIALNHACDAAYKLTASDNYKFDNHLLKNLADYCAKKIDNAPDLSEPEPTTHSGTNVSGDYAKGLLNIEGNKAKLVKGENNEYWWKWAYEKRVKGKTINTYPTPFNEVTDYNTQAESKSINLLCEKSYKKVKNHISSDLLNKINDLCTVKASAADKIVEPTEETEPSTTSILLTTVTDYKSAFAKKTENQKSLIDPSKGETWWTWSFNNRYPTSQDEKNKLPELFRSIDKGHSGTSEQTALNQACKVAYNKPKSELEANVESGHKKLIEAIKDLCAKKNPTPTLTADEPKFVAVTNKSLYTGGVGSIDDNLPKLADPRSNDSEEWWDEKFKEFQAVKSKGDTTLSE